MKDSLYKGLTAAGTGVVAALLGGWDRALEILLIVMIIDYITGFSAAFITKALKSSKGYEGLLKKGSMFLVVILAAQVDRLTGNANAVFRTCTTFFFIANEGLSIIENAKKIGIEFPAFIEKFMLAFKRAHDDCEQIHPPSHAYTVSAPKDDSIFLPIESPSDQCPPNG